MPEGNYVIIKGNAADANADFLRAGYEEVIGDAVEAGDITIVGESYTDNWDPATAQTNMEQFLTDADNDVQAVLVENDSMAGGVVSALEAQGLAGQVPVGGQDGDLPALNRVALGTQTVSVWKDARLLGTAAGEAALALCESPDLSAVEGTETFSSPGGNELTSILLEPQAITQDNLDVVLDAGWIDQATLCQGVEAGTVAVCDEAAGAAGSAPADTASRTVPLPTRRRQVALRPTPRRWTRRRRRQAAEGPDIGARAMRRIGARRVSPRLTP